MVDRLSPAERSALMSKIRGTGNRSTEMVVQAALEQRGLPGWEKHAPDVDGRPDFLYRRLKVAIFVDGCFWHGCTTCLRTPKTRKKFWLSKIERNKYRDSVTRRGLRRQGYRVLRVWEHQAKSSEWLRSLARLLSAAVAEALTEDDFSTLQLLAFPGVAHERVTQRGGDPRSRNKMRKLVRALGLQGVGEVRDLAAGLCLARERGAKDEARREPRSQVPPLR